MSSKNEIVDLMGKVGFKNLIFFIKGVGENTVFDMVRRFENSRMHATTSWKFNLNYNRHLLKYNLNFC